MSKANFTKAVINSLPQGSVEQFLLNSSKVRFGNLMEKHLKKKTIHTLTGETVFHSINYSKKKNADTEDLTELNQSTIEAWGRILEVAKTQLAILDPPKKPRKKPYTKEQAFELFNEFFREGKIIREHNGETIESKNMEIMFKYPSNEVNKEGVSITKTKTITISKLIV